MELIKSLTIGAMEDLSVSLSEVNTKIDVEKMGKVSFLMILAKNGKSDKK